MPASPRQIVLCSYHYDPLNPTIGWAPHGAPGIQRFYRKDRLATEIQAAAKYSFFEHDHHVLAQRRQTGTSVDTTLLTTDQQRSVLNALDATQPNRLAYSPYGHRPQGNGLLSLLGFNGERPDPVTGHYHLGNGYRQFNPVLLRFNSPDSLSPFGEGGLNAYVYCAGDPVNRVDPTGHRFTDMFKDWFIAKTASPPSERLLQAVMWKKHTYEGARAIENLAGKSGLSPHQYVLNSVVNDTLERHSILKQRFGENVNTDSLQALQNYQELMSEAYDIARLLRDFNDKRILAPEMYTKVNQANSKTFDIMTTLDKNTPTEIATLRQRHLELRPPPPYTEFPDSFSHVNPSAPLETSAAGLRGALPTRHK